MAHTTFLLLHRLFCGHAESAAGRSGSKRKHHGEYRLCADAIGTTAVEIGVLPCLRSLLERAATVPRSLEKNLSVRVRMCVVRAP